MGVVTNIVKSVAHVIDPSIPAPSSSSSNKGGIGGFLSDPIGSIGHVVSTVANTVTKTVENVVHNPLPVIETAVLVVGVGIPPSVASAAVAAANGTKKIEDIAKAAVAGEVGAQVAGQMPTTVAGSQTIGTIAASAVGGSSTATTQALLSGKPLDQALQIGVQAGASAAAGAGVGLAEKAVGQEIQQALPSGGDTLAQVKAAVQPVTDVVKAAGQAIDPAVQAVKQALPSTQPIQQAIQDVLPAKSDLPQLPSSVLKAGQAAGDIVAKDITGAAATGLGTGLGEAIFGQPLAKSTPGTPTSGSGTAAPQTGASPGSQALAQALNVGDPLFDKTGGTPKNVWNQASLRVKDETGT